MHGADFGAHNYRGARGLSRPAHDTRYARVWKRYLTWRVTFISNVLILSSCYNYPVVTSDIRFDREF